MKLACKAFKFLLKTTFITQLVLLGSFTAFAKNTDSLLVQYRQAKADTSKLTIINELLTGEDYTNTALGQYVQWKLAICFRNLKTRNKSYVYYLGQLADALYMAAYVDYYNTNLPKAELKFSLAKRLHSLLKNESSVAYDLNFLGNVSKSQGKMEQAKLQYNQALAIFRKLKDYDNEAAALSNLGGIYLQEGNLQKQAEILYDELKIYEKLEDKEDIANTLNSLGGLFIIEKEYDKAYKYLNQSLALKQKIKAENVYYYSYRNFGKYYSAQNQFVKAIYYFDKALKISKTEAEIVNACMYKGEAEFNNKSYDAALSTYKRAMQSADELNLATIYPTLAFIAYYREQYASAIAQAQKALRLGLDQKNLETTKLAYECLYLSHAKLGHLPQTMDYLKQYQMYNDSLSISKNKSLGLKAEFKFESEKKEAQIKVLSQQKEIASLANKQKNTLLYSLIVGVIGLISIGSIGFSRYKAKQQNELLQVKLTETENTLKAEQKASESELKALKSQMNPHFIYNALNNIQQQFMYGDKLAANEQMSNFALLTRQILSNSGKKSITLAEELLVLERYLNLEALGLGQDFSFTFNLSDSIDEDYQTLPPMLLQPLIENSLKHGLMHKKGEKKLRISFEQPSENCLEVTIQDNGIGRTAAGKIPKADSQHKSFSTQAIIQRLQLLDKENSEELLVYSDLYDQAQQIAGTQVVVKICS
jgi:two-component system, LytTR family, sensor kinase